MNNKLHVSSSPHLRTSQDTSYLMMLVLLALVPSAVMGIVNFGWKALILMIVSMLSCVLFETLINVLRNKPNTIRDCSALITGLLLAMNLPVNAPLWIPIIGSAFAIIIVKMIFGGLGQNIVNPALAARCFLLISFAGIMCDFSGAQPLIGGIDTMSSATPLAIMKAGESISLSDAFIGFTSGTIGETSAMALFFGGVFLVFKKVIDIRIPLSYILSFVIMMGIIGPKGFDLYYLACQVCSGGLMLGAWFMATDYVTSPITPNGRLIFGIVLGILTALFRCGGSSIEGVSYAILFGNLLVPLIEKITIRTAFGRRGGKHA